MTATLDVTDLVARLERLLLRLGRGPVTVLYTNSPKDDANLSFPAFRAALEHSGFALIADQKGEIQIERWGGSRQRELRYALFQRQTRDVLTLGED